MNQARNQALVIGAGIAGLAASIRIALKGYSVTVLEANNYAGGKLSEIRKEAYRFDAGPSLFTMPQFVDELFDLAGKNPRDYFNYKKLAVSCQYFYEDGTFIKAFADPQDFARELAKKTKDEEASVLRYLEKSKEKYELTAPVFLHNSLHQLSNYLKPYTLKGILNFYKLDVFQSMHQSNQRYFQDPRVVQLFNRYATYNGSDPYQTPGIMNLIPHLEFGIGAFFPQGGMYQITQSLLELARDLGVRFIFNAPVQRIVTEKNRLRGAEVQLEGKKEFFPAQVLVSNVDVVNTYRKLLPSVKAPARLLKQPKSSSALIFYWGIHKSFPELSLHNIFFSERYREEFQYLFQKKDIFPDPTVYINISSKENPSDAPEGAENWFTMINVPHNAGQDWERLIPKARKYILEKLGRNLGQDIEPYIEVEEILDPRLIEQKTASSAGALYGNSSNNRYAAFLRHANFSSRIKNLHFCGGSVHPGGGIPLCLLSAKIASSFIKPTSVYDQS